MNELVMATILGGRWDGLEVEYTGPSVMFRDERYVVMRTESGRMHYLLKVMADEWFEFTR